MTSLLVIFRAFLFYFFRPPTLNLKKYSRKSTNKKILAYTRNFKQSGILTCVDSDKPVRPPFKLRNFKYVQAVALES